MLIGDIEFPEPLINARRRGTLIVFAGAGVSMHPPSNLPDFESLANQVASGALERSKDEPIDQFFGRLVSNGVDVHGRTRDIIDQPNSKPNLLHKALLSLFPSHNTLRLVTTNFDRHFTLVAKEIFSNNVNLFYAPALPLGHDFNGIVYLHGCIDTQSKDLVLTDQDFGRAYLTYGWATRFLQAMFANYATLFVGYSHNDRVMHYLSRALPYESKPRYALTVSGSEERWKFLGVIPLTYRKAKGKYRHSPLQRSIQAWSEYAKWGALDHERRIKRIVELPPPVNLEESGYLESALRELENVRFFMRYAKIPAWLRWAEDKLLSFRDIFQPTYQLNEIAEIFATWFAHNFVCEYPEEALAALQRQNQRISLILWDRIALRLSLRDPRPDPKTFGKWVSVLLQAPYHQELPELLGYLLKSCRYPEDRESAILLFEHMTRPKLHLRPKFVLSDEGDSQVDAEVTIQAKRYWLKEAWGNYFRPHLLDFVEHLETIVETNLRQAHHLLCSMGKANDRWDPISFSRVAIEPHSQNRYSIDDMILIDAARDILECLLVHQPDHASHLIESWVKSKIPLLRRLAIHGMSESATHDADDKAAWLLENGLLYKYGVKHEVFRLLKLTYSNTRDETRLRLLEQVERGPQGQDAKGKNAKDRKYAIYNLLFWLHQAAPDCKLTLTRLKEIQKANPEFRAHEHPDVDSWITEFVGPRSPITASELLASNPEYTIDFLLCYQGNRFMGPDREGLLAIVAEAVSQSFDWSWRLVVALQKKEDTGFVLDIWASVLHGWQHTSMTEEQWNQVLTLLDTHPKLNELAEATADLIKHGMTEGKAGLPESCLPLAEKITDRLWDVSVSISKGEVLTKSDDWLGMAINHLGGTLVEIWFHALSKRHAKSGTIWKGIPLEFKCRFEKVLSGESLASQLGRVLIASRIHFLFALDTTWTQERIFPLLDWSISEKQAQQAWHGYLVWGRWSQAMLPNLMPLYEKTFPKLKDNLNKELQDDFCRHLASIAVFSTTDPLRDGWLWNFLKLVGGETRRSWAIAVRLELDSLNEDAIQTLWDRWINKYWSERITGIPVPLGQDEIEEMAYWAIELSPVFPEVVEKIRSSNPPKLENTHIYHDLEKRHFATKHPIALTKLLLHLLPNAAQPFWQRSDVEGLVRSLIATPAPRCDLLDICHELGRLNCPNAKELGDLCGAKLL